MTQARRLLLMLLASWLGGCSGMDFSILGYTTAPQYQADIRTVRVPVFKNQTYVRGLEFELTEAVIKQIEARTPWKVANGAGCEADTELTGTIVRVNKRTIIQNQLNETREADLVIGVQLVWRDLRTGEILSNPPSRRQEVPFEPLPDALHPAAPAPAAVPVLIQQNNSFVVDLGESLSSARKQLCQDLARQIVGLMESPW